MGITFRWVNLERELENSISLCCELGFTQCPAQIGDRGVLDRDDAALVIENHISDSEGTSVSCVSWCKE